MTPRRILLLLLALAATATACSIPSRDNRLDPTNIPDVQIAIYEDSLSLEPIVQAAFTESIFLSASSSEPSDHGLRVRWFVDASSGRYPVPPGNEVPISQRQGVRLNNVLPKELIASGVIGVSIVASVRDPKTGGIAEGSRFFQVFNSPPVLAHLPYAEVSPGGRWWYGGGEQPIQAVLDVTATDPDEGDLATVTWEQISGRPVATNTPEQNVDDLTVTAPFWEQTVKFRATARDSADTETSAEITLAVQDVVWVGDATGFVGRAQEPPIAVLTSNAAWVAGAATTAGGDTVIWTAEDDGDSWRIVRRVPEVGGSQETSWDSSIANTEPLLGAAFTNNDGRAWFAIGDTILGFEDLETGVDPAGPSVMLSGTLLALEDGITAPHSLAPVTGSAAGDVWALFDEAQPTVRRLTAAGASAPLQTIPNAIAIDAAPDGGAWVLVSEPANASAQPQVIRLDSGGARTATLDLPHPATARARAFSARAPLIPAEESLRFVVAGGDTAGNAFLALVDAIDTTSGAPSDGADESTTQLRVAYRLQEALVSDVAMDPQDGGAWSVVASTGVVRKHDFLGNVVRTAGALDFQGTAPPTLEADVRTGNAWIADQGFLLLGVSGTALVPYPDSSALSLPDLIQLDPTRNRIAVASAGDSSVVILQAGRMTNQFFLPDLGAITGPVGATFDPDTGCLWFGSKTQLRRNACKNGTSPWPNGVFPLAPIVSMHALDFAPWHGAGGVTPGLCVAGSDGGQLRVMRLDPETGASEWPVASIVSAGTAFLGLSASPGNGDCWFLTDQSVGYARATDGAVFWVSPQTGIGRSLSTSPNGNAYFIDPDDDEIVEVRPDGTIDPSFLSFAPDATYRNARSLSVDPVRGVIWVSVGPDAADPSESAAALLQFAPDGQRIGLVPAIDPRFVSVNR